MHGKILNIHGKRYLSVKSFKDYVKSLNKASPGTIYEEGSDAFNALRKLIENQ